MSAKVRINTKKLEQKLKALERNSRSAFKNAINRTVTYGRREITAELIRRTGLPRRRIFDAINIGRASDESLTGNITAIFPGENGEKRVTRIWLSEFRYRSMKILGTKWLVGAGPRYGKLLRTGFRAQFSCDSKKEIYLREGKKLVRARAAQIPTMFEDYDIPGKWMPVLKERITSEVAAELRRKASEGK